MGQNGADNAGSPEAKPEGSPESKQANPESKQANPESKQANLEDVLQNAFSNISVRVHSAHMDATRDINIARIVPAGAYDAAALYVGNALRDVICRILDSASPWCGASRQNMPIVEIYDRQADASGKKIVYFSLSTRENEVVIKPLVDKIGKYPASDVLSAYVNALNAKRK